MHGNVPVPFGRGRLDSLGNRGLAAYLMLQKRGVGRYVRKTDTGDQVASGAVQAVILRRMQWSCCSSDLPAFLGRGQTPEP